ncbi:MAG TPA: beta-ketoacyl-[acyl-carrier-protein] synthase family protein, partial [Candidatus Omnitrophota bacterium]|nr:beta-ketoacyl-[acyl-carrier-protein] synthase family protein [Candidatus Omnitrophota bacterium]
MGNNGKNRDRRVVITGLGVVSSLGIGWEPFWKNLVAGKSGISRITTFDTSLYDRHNGGEVKDFDPKNFIDRRSLRHLGRTSQMAIVASKLALKDSGLNNDQLRREITGVCVGTTMGEPQVMESLNSKYFPQGKRMRGDHVAASLYPACAISNNVASYFKLKGPNFIFSSACAAGNYAILHAFHLLKTGRADYMVTGGADALSRVAFTGFFRLFTMAPEKCQPFDKNRKGMLVGEGAGMMVMESLEEAQKRNATIYAEILGGGLACDALHMTDPSIEGISKAIQKSLDNSCVSIADIDYINAHGTGTRGNDKAESLALNKVFGKRLQNIPISSIKSMLGHTMGA